MKKIWIAVILPICLFIGSGIYVHILKDSINTMNNFVAEAYACTEYSYTDIPEKLNRIELELNKNEIMFCAFIDQKLISDVKDELMIAKELYTQHSTDNLKISLIRLYEKINYLKSNEEFNIKKIL